MGAINEYLKLVPLGIKSREKLVEGIVNSVRMSSLPEDEQEEIIRRRIACATCPYMSKNREGYVSARKEEHCTLCSCSILFKTASLSSDCGAKSYNLSHPEDPKPILWEKYVKNKTDDTTDN